MLKRVRSLIKSAIRAGRKSLADKVLKAGGNRALKLKGLSDIRAKEARGTFYAANALSGQASHSKEATATALEAWRLNTAQLAESERLKRNAEKTDRRAKWLARKIRGKIAISSTFTYCPAPPRLILF